jgi:hypothetical protein
MAVLVRVVAGFAPLWVIASGQFSWESQSNGGRERAEPPQFFSLLTYLQSPEAVAPIRAFLTGNDRSRFRPQALTATEVDPDRDRVRILQRSKITTPIGANRHTQHMAG